MLPKRHRLAKSKDVKLTLKAGRSFFNPFFQVKTFFGDPILTATVVCSNKVSKKATERNRIKRQVREVLKAKLSDLPNGKYVVICKAGVEKLENPAIKNHLLEVLQKLSGIRFPKKTNENTFDKNH